MDKKIYYNELYDYYKGLLTDKQRTYYENYYFQDYSLAEIAENEKVSRNAVHNQLKIVLERLDFYEEQLQNYQKAQEIRKLIQNIDNEIKERIEEII